MYLIKKGWVKVIGKEKFRYHSSTMHESIPKEHLAGLKEGIDYEIVSDEKKKPGILVKDKDGMVANKQ